MKYCKQLILIIIAIFLSTSCNFFNFNYKKTRVDEVPYIQNKVWSINTDSLCTDLYNRQYENYYYILEYDRSEGEKKSYYTKIDLRDGTRVWSSNPIKENIKNYPLLYSVNNKKYFITEKGKCIIQISDDDTGELCATVSFYKTEEERDHYGIAINNWLLINGKLYWANCPNFTPYKSGIVSLDISNIDFSKPADEVQYFEPEMVWENTVNNQRIFEALIEHNGIIYFITNNMFEKDDCCILGAYDSGSKSLLWQKKSYVLTGLGCNNLIIAKNKLYVLEEAQGCYDLYTGSTVWEHRQTLEEMKKEVGIDAGMYAVGITYYDNKFYFTNSGGSLSSSMTGIDEQYIKNIQCIDADTGKYIWGDLPKGSASLFTRPVVIDDQCFIITWNDLRVYNAQTGELIGTDSSVTSVGYEYNALYDGMFIYFNPDYDAKTSQLVAIRPY